MQALKFESGGMSLTFKQCQGAELYVNFNEFDDSGAKGIFEQYKIPGMDGGITTTTQFDRRTISFKFLHDLRASNAAATTAIIQEIFNPKIVGKLIYQRDNGEQRYMLCRPQRSALCTAQKLNVSLYTAELTADIPYWLSADKQHTLSTTTNTINNTCKFTVYPKITLTSKGYISNVTTGEKIEVVKEINASNEQLVYDCAIGEVQFLKKQNDTWNNIYDGELIFSNLSNRLSLVPGTNGIVATATGSIKYNLQYLEKG